MFQTQWFLRTQTSEFFRLLISVVLMASAACVAAATTVDELLEDHSGTRRPILVFGADIDDKAVAQIGALWSKRSELVDRDILIVRVQPEQVVVQRTGRSKDGRNKEVETLVEPSLAAAFRARFDVKADDFAVILIGKDGEIKRRSDLVLDAADIFHQIDAMPMRQNEIRSAETANQ